MAIKVLQHLTDAQIETRAWYTVYRLIDPLNSQVRYIGQTKYPFARLTEHCNHPTNQAMQAWIQALKQQGFKPIFEIIEDGSTERKAAKQEKYWIETYLAQGFQLLNVRHTPNDERTTNQRHSSNP